MDSIASSFLSFFSFALAAIAKLRSSRHAALQLKPVLPGGDYPTARLVTQHTIAAATADDPDITFTRKQDLTFAPDDTNIERFIRILTDFDEACFDELLKLHNTDCHKKAPECSVVISRSFGTTPSTRILTH